MNYAETLDYLFTAMPSFQNIGAGAYKPGLDRVNEFLQHLGSPHLRYEVIHVAGTNGKGSVSHTLASVIHHSGKRTGLFTSPHLRDFRERIRVEGEMISEQETIDFVQRHREEMERIGLSFFEMTAAMAFAHFARCGVEVAVIETGLGGRLDATNVVSPRLSIITNIGLDHTYFLGETLPEIAREKGGIIKPSTPVILGERGEEYTQTIVDIAHAQGSRLIFAEDISRLTSQTPHQDGQIITLRDTLTQESITLSLDLGGEYQAQNIVTVYAAAKELGLSEEALRRGVSEVVATTSLIGRWQWLSRSPRVICDTGHNAHGIKYIAKQLLSTPHRRLIMVLGFANDKSLEEILPLYPSTAHFIFTRAKISRAMELDKIAQTAQHLALCFEIKEDSQEALSYAKSICEEEDLIFVGGSNFVVAEIL